MKRFFFVIVLLILLPLEGITKPDKNKDVSFSKNDKIIIASLINLSYLTEGKKGGDKTGVLKIRDKDIIGYINENLKEIENSENSKKADYLIDKIKKYSDNQYFKDYVDGLKDFYSDNLKAYDLYKKWYSVKEGKTGFILIKQKQDKRYGLIIYKQEENKTDDFGKLLDYYKNFISILPIDKEIFLKFPILKKVIFVKPIYSYPGIKNIMLYPPLNSKTIDSERGIIVFEVLNEKREYGKRVEKYLKNIKKSGINREMITNFKIFHLIFHSIGPFYMEDEKSIIVKDRLKEFFYPIEEMKAELLSYLFVDFLIKQGKLEQNGVETNFVIYLLNQKGKKGLYPISRNFLLNYLLDKGGIFMEKNKIILNIQKITPALSLLLSDIVEMEYKGDYVQAQKIIKKYGSFKFEIQGK
jgi:hypothetical protein